MKERILKRRKKGLGIFSSSGEECIGAAMLRDICEEIVESVVGGGDHLGIKHLHKFKKTIYLLETCWKPYNH
jgi:hypothetical protein